MIRSQKIGLRLVSFEMIFEASQSQKSRKGLKIQKIPGSLNMISFQDPPFVGINS